jgi:hypothetical protein
MPQQKLPVELILEELLLVAAARLADGGLAVCGWLQRSQDDEATISKVIYWTDAGWLDGPTLPWEAVSMCSYPGPEPTSVVLGREGHIALVRADRTEDLPLVGSPAALGPFRRVCVCDGQVFVLGEDRGVYVLHHGAWSRLEKGFPQIDVAAFDDLDQAQEAIAAGTEVLFALAAFSAKDVCAVGTDGEVWLFDRDTWQRVDIPMNLTLFDVTVGADGVYHACGQRGIVVRGHRGAWGLVSTGDADQDFVGIASAGEGLYLATGYASFRFAAGKLEPLTYDTVPMPGHFVLADGELRLVLARKEIFASTDGGQTWSSLLG